MLPWREFNLTGFLFFQNKWAHSFILRWDFHTLHKDSCRLSDRSCLLAFYFHVTRIFDQCVEVLWWSNYICLWYTNRPIVWHQIHTCLWLTANKLMLMKNLHCLDISLLIWSAFEVDVIKLQVGVNTVIKVICLNGFNHCINPGLSPAIQYNSQLLTVKWC